MLRDETRVERERLAGREAAVAAAESALEGHRRDLERQAAEINTALQVRCWPCRTACGLLVVVVVVVVVVKGGLFCRERAGADVDGSCGRG